jgi:hypothetical protein
VPAARSVGRLSLRGAGAHRPSGSQCESLRPSLNRPYDLYLLTLRKPRMIRCPAAGQSGRTRIVARRRPGEALFCTGLSTVAVNGIAWRS